MFYYEHNCAHTGPSHAGTEYLTNLKCMRNCSKCSDYSDSHREGIHTGEADLNSYSPIITLPLLQIIS